VSDPGLPNFRIPFTDASRGTVTREWTYWVLNPTVQSVNISGSNGISVPNGTVSAKNLKATNPLPTTSGGLGINTGTSGGIIGFTGTTTVASSTLLGANQIVLGGGAGATPATPLSLGSVHVVLHGNAAGAPTWSAVDLSADVTGALPVANGGTGTNAAGATAANNIGALAIASNLSDLNNATTARTNLGLGSMAVENANAVAITGGSIDGTTLGITTPAAGKHTTLVATGTVTFTSGTIDGIVIGAVTPAAGTYTTLTNTAGRADTSYSYQQPATGFSITIANGVYTLILDPAGALLTGTIIMPSAPGDGQVIRITSTQNITTLTVNANAGQSIKNAPTGFTVSLTGDQGYEFIYRAANTTWYRLQ
jgi:hypothetical protein